MTYYITHLKDTIGNNYLGIKLPNGAVQLFLNQLKDIIGDADFEKYTDLQQKRDHGEHHITVINVMDYNKISKEMGIDNFINSLEKIFKYEIDDMKMLGVGTATKNENRAYFIVCDSDKLAAIRTRYNLPKQDFHATLGFLYKDVFGVPKNIIMKKNDKFLKLLSQEYYNNENWNFIKNIGNFDLDRKAEVIPVKIGETTMKVKCDGYFMDISYLEDGEKFWITSKYSIDKEMPRMPETEIKRLMSDKNIKVNELKINYNQVEEDILEMARINDISDFKYDVFIYGGNSYGSGRNEHGEPHFHFSDKIKSGNWEFSILIPTVEEWNQSKELYISETSNGDYNWTGFKREKNNIMLWLDRPNHFLNSMTNLEFIRLQWNVLNTDNKNVKQIIKIK
jgi:hypothetical protein